jgi:calcium permeable stress-gated cation channel
MYINRTFDRAFRYYIPTEDELRVAKVHSERADVRSNKLERRFGHPALHAELFTPMLHAKMMPLLREVYRGKIDETSAKMDEYGGEKMRAQVVPGGIMIAAVDQVSVDPLLIGGLTHNMLSA